MYFKAYIYKKTTQDCSRVVRGGDLTHTSLIEFILNVYKLNTNTLLPHTNIQKKPHIKWSFPKPKLFTLKT